MTVEKAFKYGFVLGRFQHVHIGHELMIDTALAVCERVLVLVGSAQLQGTERNPFSAERRIELLSRLYGERVQYAPLADYSHENDHSHAWGAYLLGAVKSCGQQQKFPALDLMVFGSDEERAAWFPKEELAGIAQLSLPRSKQPISATRLREALAKGDKPFWEHYVNPALHGEYDSLREELLRIPAYNELNNKP
ncbi:adenylyltransferase/cytidyltransferase family protein [Paenibacillus sp. NEAU-GSW1]|uniref:adenylyltransferase/cytidyltransferase family protein n=1 Tax=Paenibacillus sp. NEAU-GSW1 TaxID=2682486 RepID=UPI0012E12D63|nr:adenylyltransferase/cytidyltransferase family protein [Paenibacillus sp. NEAU-GSW1]MUT65840.1 adenylyltransferase/cytidyltransferase family protein [Paenibacillus sp. NEAU-GSW1]